VVFSWKVSLSVSSLFVSVTVRALCSTAPGSLQATGKQRKSSPLNLPSAWQMRWALPFVL
jgi:hypothetical protein